MIRKVAILTLGVLSLSCASSRGETEVGPVAGTDATGAFNCELSPELVRQRTGWLLEIPGLYDDETRKRMEDAAKFYATTYRGRCPGW